jgi:hypothetical protein
MLQGLLSILGGVLFISNSLLEDICFDEVWLVTFLLRLLMCLLELRCMFLRFVSETPTTLPKFLQALFTIFIQLEIERDFIMPLHLAALC